LAISSLKLFKSEFGSSGVLISFLRSGL